jgi:hypothetical protein
VKSEGEDEKKAVKTQLPSPKTRNPNITKNSKIPSHPQVHKT